MKHSYSAPNLRRSDARLSSARLLLRPKSACVPLPTARREACSKDIIDQMMISDSKQRSFNLSTALTVRALMIKGVSRANIARTGLSLKGMSWNNLEDEYQGPSRAWMHPEHNYLQDLHSEKDLMKERITLKFQQLHLKDISIFTNQVDALARSRVREPLPSFVCVRGALLANAHWKGPSSERVLKVVLKMEDRINVRPRTKVQPRQIFQRSYFLHWILTINSFPVKLRGFIHLAINLIHATVYLQWTILVLWYFNVCGVVLSTMNATTTGLITINLRSLSLPCPHSILRA